MPKGSQLAFIPCVYCLKVEHFNLLLNLLLILKRPSELWVICYFVDAADASGSLGTSLCPAVQDFMFICVASDPSTVCDPPTTGVAQSPQPPSVVSGVHTCMHAHKRTPSGKFCVPWREPWRCAVQDHRVSCTVMCLIYSSAVDLTLPSSSREAQWPFQGLGGP